MLTFEGDKRYSCCDCPVPILTCNMGGAQEIVSAHCNKCGANVTARARELRQQKTSNPDATFVDHGRVRPLVHQGAEAAVLNYIAKAGAYDSGDEARIAQAERAGGVLADIIGRLHKRGLLTDADIAEITGFEVAEK